MLEVSTGKHLQGNKLMYYQQQQLSADFHTINEYRPLQTTQRPPTEAYDDLDVLRRPLEVRSYRIAEKTNMQSILGNQTMIFIDK